MNYLITGASGGIGSAILSAIQKKGNVFFLQYHNTDSKPSKKSESYPVQADLTNEAEITNLAHFINAKGGVDVIIHSVSVPTDMADITQKDWKDFQSHIDIQVKSLFLLVKLLSPSMKKKKFGRIIALTSEYTVGRPPNKLADYVTAKHALVGLIKAYAVELGVHGVTANCISAGLTDTKLTEHLPSKLKEIIAHQTPQKRLTTPQDIAALVSFLSSKDAGMITGENIVINGGYVMR